MIRLLFLLCVIALAILAVVWILGQLRRQAVHRPPPVDRPWQKIEEMPRGVDLPEGRHSVEERLAQVEDVALERLLPWFAAAGLEFPPAKAVLLAFKEEQRIDLYAGTPGEGIHWIRSYPVLAASGQPGPKLREGDRQVPEGFYEVELLNPNSRHHLSLRLNYPNAEDRTRAKEDGRSHEDLGGDIMIHGKAASIGCLAIGDAAVEELFVLAARTGLRNLRVVISPCDFRMGNSVELPESVPAWTGELHDRLKEIVQTFPLPGNSISRQD